MFDKWAEKGDDKEKKRWAEKKTEFLKTKPSRSSVEALGMDPLPDGADIAFCELASANLLAKAVHVAFFKHYPLRLSPDVIWLTCVQGLAKHIAKNPEQQRSSVGVTFEGRETISVARPDFVKGSSENDWESVFPQFAKGVAGHIGEDMVELLENSFSTTTSTDKICSHIALLDCVKHYFAFDMACGCGIPSIELTGTVEDWRKVREKAEVLNRFAGLEWWTDELLPVLDHFVSAASGQPDLQFWKSVCNLHGASGSWSSFVTGWIQVMFPYTVNNERNENLNMWQVNFAKGGGNETELLNAAVKDGAWKGDLPSEPDHYGKTTLENIHTEEDAYYWAVQKVPELKSDSKHRNRYFEAPTFKKLIPALTVGRGMDLQDIPSGLSQAPFIYTDEPSNTAYKCSFNGGIVAVLQHSGSLALEPVTGWAVLEHDEDAWKASQMPAERQLTMNEQFEADCKAGGYWGGDDEEHLDNKRNSICIVS
jgi:hypothetical protein